MYSGATRPSPYPDPVLCGRAVDAPAAIKRASDHSPARSVEEPRGSVGVRRVLVVAFQTGRHADGGLESLTQLLERYEGIEVTVMTQAVTTKNERWRGKGCRVIVRTWDDQAFRRARWSWRRAWQYFSWNAAAAWQAWTDGVEIAHVNDPLALWHVAVGLRILGVPVVFNIRDTKARVSRREVWKWRAAFHLTQAQIVLSWEMRNYWSRVLEVPGRRMAAVYSIVDPHRMRPASAARRRELRERLGFPDGFVIGYVASFSEKKAQLRFIEAVGPAWLRSSPASHVCFLGDFSPESDSYAAACARRVGELGLGSRFAFKGYVAQPETWYPAFDVVLVATQNEGLARCMIESLASGTPVVSFDVCSAREILETGDCGRVVEQGDYAGLVATLTRLQDDGPERERLGQNATALATRLFSPAANVGKYLEIYHAVVGAGQVA